MRTLIWVVLCLGACGPDKSGGGGGSGTSAITDPALDVQMLHPMPGAEVTDIGLSFTWYRPNHFSRDADKRWAADKFQIQVSDGADFDAPVIDREVFAVGHDTSGFDPHEGYPQKLMDHWREAMWMPVETLPEGDYQWRIRVIDMDGGGWSDAVSFQINTDHTHAASIRPLSAEQPIFSFDMYDADGGGWGEDPRERWGEVWGTVPPQIQDSVVLAVPHEYWGKDPAIDGVDLTYGEFVQPLADADIPYIIKTGGPDGDFQWYMSPAELEHLYQTQPNLLGLVTGENTWSYIRAWEDPHLHDENILWLERVIQLSAKYGRYVVLGEGSYDFVMERWLGQQVLEDSRVEGEFQWMEQDFIRTHADTIIWAPKNNIQWSYHHADSMVLGAWLSGLTTHLGLWSEAWYWSDAGYTTVFSEEYQSENDADFSAMPYALWVQMQMMSASKGAVFYHFGGESGVVTDEGAYDAETDALYYEDDEGDWVLADVPVFGLWDMYGHALPAFSRYVAPFIEAVTEHKMIPTKAEVLAEVKVAVRPGPVEARKGSFACYGDFSPLYLATYGIENWVDTPRNMNDDEFMEAYDPPTGCRTDLMPGTGRYYWIPMLPHPIEDLPDADVHVVELDELSAASAVSAIFDSRYPERATGDAFISMVGDVVYITNGHENTDGAQSYSVPLSGRVTQLTGTVHPHAYLVVKRDSAGGLVIHANANHNGPYTDDRTTDLALSSATALSVTVTPAEALVSQDWADGVHRVVVSHADGAATIAVD